MIRRPPRSTQSRSSAASDVYKRQGEHDLVDIVLGADPLEIVLGRDWDALRIEIAGELGRVDAILDAGDLGGGEGYDSVARVAPKGGIEVVEVPTRRSDYDNTGWVCGLAEPTPRLCCSVLPCLLYTS